MSEYLINEWAIVRRNELPVIPKELKIHTDFLKQISKEDFETAFRQIWDMVYGMMTDISKNPEQFGMPLAKAADTLYGKPIAQESRYAAWRPMNFLNLLFRNGEIRNSCLYVDIINFKAESKIKNAHVLFKAWLDYGFVFEGLKNWKITPLSNEIVVSYPDNENVITVLSLVARKAKNVSLDLFHKPGKPDYFSEWNYRLLLDDINSFSFNDPYYILYDKMHSEKDKIFIETFHKLMIDKGYCYATGGWNEGPGILYYDKTSVRDRKGPYLHRLLSWRGELQIMLRVRSAKKCLLYVATCSDTIKEMFKKSDTGCGNRINCKHGVGYVYEGESKWKCGCCNAPFVTNPITEDIEHYLKLVELGHKR